MDSQYTQQFQDVLSRGQKLAVAVGKNPTVDEMGAALALYLSLQSMGKSVSVLSATEPIVEVSNLVGIDKVKTRFEGDGADLVVSFPYKEGEIEKVSYTIENGFLNIVVKAGEQGLNFVEQDVKYTRGGDGSIDTLIVVGTPHLSDVQGIFSMDMLKDVTVVNIDNKQENQGYGDVVLVSPRYSSVCEYVGELLMVVHPEVDIDAAQNLLDGIMYATENFQSPRTSSLAFETAAQMMRQGAVRNRMPMPAPLPRPRQDFGPQVGQQPRKQHMGQQDRDQDRRGQMQHRRQQQSRTQHSPPPRQDVSHQSQQRQDQSLVQSGQSGQHPQATNSGFDDTPPPSDWLTPKVYKGSSNV